MVGDGVDSGAVGTGVAVSKNEEEIPPLSTVEGLGVDTEARSGAGVPFETGWAIGETGLRVGAGTGAGVGGKSQSMSPPSPYNSGTQHGQSGKGTCQKQKRGKERILSG